MLSLFKRRKEKDAKRKSVVAYGGASFGSKASSSPPSYYVSLLPSCEDDFVSSQRDLEERSPFQTSSFAGGDRLRVLIVGGGIGGLATAIACARQGFAVELLERSSEPSPHGDSITLGSNAAKILFRWEIGKQMLLRSARGGWWLQHDREGRRVMQEDVRNYASLFETPILVGQRAQYLGDLGVEARLLGVKVRLNSKVVKYVDSCESPSVVLAGGEAIEADVVVVADGIHSNGRKLLKEKLGPTAGQREGRRSGYSIYRGLAPATAFKGDKKFDRFLDGNQRFWFGDDQHVTLTSLDNGRQISFTYTHRDPEKEGSLNTKRERNISEVVSHLKGWDPLLVSAIKCFRTALNWRMFEADMASQWTTDGGKTSFVGDSVHYLLPTSNQGGSQAIKDGATLAICLALAGGRPADVPLALRTYETMRKPRVAQAQALGLQTRESWHSFARTGDIPSLAFRCTTMYAHDAERHAVAEFESVARTLEGGLWFTLSAQRRASVMRKLGLDPAEAVGEGKGEED